jgi:hypothetical protein
MAHVASFLISNSIVAGNETNGGIMFASTTTCPTKQKFLAIKKLLVFYFKSRAKQKSWVIYFPP